MSIVQVLTGCTSQETAHVQADYPYGFRLRCQRRCWLEHDLKRGFRFCTQTSNPKKPGLVWNAPKKSTYTMLAVMGLDEEGHVAWTGVSGYDMANAVAFAEKYGAHFDAGQRLVCDMMVEAVRRHEARKAELAK